MPNQNQISPDTHRMIPVSGLGVVAVPIGTKFTDLHPAIIAAHPAFNPPVAPEFAGSEDAATIPNEVNPADITEQGAIENQPQFKQAAKEAWSKTLQANADAMFNGGNRNIGNTEEGFTVNTKGQPSAITEHRGKDAAGNLQQTISNDTALALHTHPPVADDDPKPSPADIAVAKRIKRPILVASKLGLFEIAPDGTVNQIFTSPDWMNAKKRK